MSHAEDFFSRWARRKADVQRGEAAPQQAPLTAALPLVEEPVAPQPSEPAPTLDDVATLAPGDEVSRFVARGVDEAVKRAAVKKLFTDPHFNLMDGLDIYIDDYGKPDPIPAAMLRQMNQSHALGLFADEDKPQVPAEPAAATIPDQEADPAAAPAAGAVPQTDDEDPDLQLQPDDAAGRPGADEGAGPGGV
ncbi:MAG TPA: DUF3306 domain-containing protein [Methylibium sp.]|nr:DUF3306 domain-containing protein [Methylibium sp.]